MVHNLEKLDGIAIPGGTGEIRVFAAVRDERVRLPHFVRHYRRLGVDRMVFIDNGSSDGTTEWLLEQSDCHVFFTRDSYAASNYGVEWVNSLLASYGLGHWCLLVDADELFVYPDFETRRFHDYVAALDAEGAEGVFAFMLDMYPDGPLEAAVLSDEADLAAVAPAFDSDYLFQRKPERPGKAPSFPPIRVLGGPRQRFARPVAVEAKRGWIRAAASYRFERLLERLPKAVRTSLAPMLWNGPTTLQKIPLVKPGADFAFGAGAHTTTRLRLARQSAVLLHYKFLADFHARVAKAIAEGEHYRGGAQYMWYQSKMEQSGSSALTYAGTARLEGSATLAALGLFRDIEAI